MTFHVSDAKELFNPYDWLPSYGENAVRFWSDKADIVVEITYEIDEDDDASPIAKRELRFLDVCAFYKSAFPGAAGLVDISYDSKWPIGSLIMFQRSDVADAWTTHLSNRFEVKHYLMQFTSENLQIHVFAKDYVLNEEVRSA